MRDLDIRGAGNLLGGDQSVFIAEIGFEMYQKILDEAIRELKRNEFRDLYKEEIQKQDDFVSDCSIDTDLEILLPSDFVNNVTERLVLYKDLDSLQNEEQLVEYESKLRDRFGPIPVPAKQLLNTIRLRWLAEKLGFEKILLKNKRFIGYFVSNPTSPFYQSEIFTGVLKFVQTNSQRCRLKEEKSRLSLTMKDIESVDQANTMLQKILGIVE